MASWSVSAIAIGLLACSVLLCTADECSTKMEDLQEYYEGNTECEDTVTILNKETECKDSDKEVLAKCLKKKESEWEDVIENCGSIEAPSSSEGEPTPDSSDSEAPAEAPSADDEVESSLSDSVDPGRRLLSESGKSCMELLFEKGLKEFEAAGSLSSSLSIAALASIGAIAMMVM